MSVNLELLNFFCSVVEYGSFSEAAKKMYISQPAITNKIHFLEQQLNTKLFYRNHSGIVLTKDGNSLYREIKEPILKLRKLDLNKKILKNNTAKVTKIGIDNKIFETNFVYNDLTAFNNKKINLEKIEPDIAIKYLNSNQIDYYLIHNSNRLRRKNIRSLEKLNLETCFYANTDFFEINKSNFNLENINKFTFILPKEGTIEREIFNKLNINVKDIYEVNSPEIKNVLINKGIGIAFGFKQNIYYELKNNQYKEIDLKIKQKNYKLDIIENTKIEEINSYKANNEPAHITVSLGKVNGVR